MNEINLPLNNIATTQKLAEQIVTKLQIGDTLCLRGALGSGKTRFTSLLINALSAKKQNVTSPTFNIMQIYGCEIDGKIHDVIHADLYRLHREEEIHEIGLLDYIGDKIVIIEWPELIEQYLPKDRLDIFFSLRGNKRRVKIIPLGLSWQQKLNKLSK